MRPGNLGSTDYWFGSSDNFVRSRFGSSAAIYFWHLQQQQQAAAAAKKKKEVAAAAAAKKKKENEERRRRAEAAAKQARAKQAQILKACGPAPTHQCPPPGCVNCPPFGGGKHTCNQKLKKWVCHNQPCKYCGRPAKPKMAPKRMATKVQPKGPARPRAPETKIRRCVNRIKGLVAANRITPVRVCGRDKCTDAEYRKKCGG
jgi:hypothetical protein